MTTRRWTSAAASAADGAFYNTGQSCCAVERIYVHRDLFDPFVEAFTAQVRGFRRGDPRDEATYIGPLARSAQVEVLEAQVRDALAQRRPSPLRRPSRRRPRQLLRADGAGRRRPPHGGDARRELWPA